MRKVVLFKVLLLLRKVVRCRDFLRTRLPRRLSLVGADTSHETPLPNPNTREPKKEISWLRTHGTLPSRSHLLAFLGLFLFFFSHVPFLWWQTTFLGLSFFSRPLLVATDHLGGFNGFHVRVLVCSLSKQKSFAFLTWATFRTKKNLTANLVCSSSVLDFSLSCVKRLVGKKSSTANSRSNLYG